MSRKFFTSHDGTVWISKASIKKLIEDTFDIVPNKKQVKRFKDLLIIDIDAIYGKEFIITINAPNVDQFYCGSCRHAFPVSYKKEDIRSDHIPCPRCGAQAMRAKTK